MVCASSTVSPAKLRANRENARKSTGPRAAEGKRRSARNALKHGIFCPFTVLEGESHKQYQAILQAHIARLDPVDLVELSLVEQIADARSRLARCRHSEADLLALEGRWLRRKRGRGRFRSSKLSFGFLCDLCDLCEVFSSPLHCPQVT